MILTPFILKIINFKLFDTNYDFILFSLVGLMGITLIANSFFVSLLAIEEKN